MTRTPAPTPRLVATARCFRGLAAALLVWLIAPAAQGGDTRSKLEDPPKAELKVVLAEPTGEQSELYEISASFDAPMVRLGERGRSSRRGPIRLEPSLRGSFTWLGTTTVSFQPEAPPAPGTRITCTIPAGTRSLAGHRLANDVVWTIEYRRPRLTGAIPRLSPPRRDGTAAPPSGPHPVDDPLLLAFDRPAAPDAAEVIQLVGPAGPVPLHPVPVTDAHVEAIFGREAGVDRRSLILALAPATPLLADTTYTLTVPAGLPFPGAQLDLGRTTEGRFRTLGPLRVQSIRTGQAELGFAFSSEVDPETLLARIRLDPRPPHLEARRGWDLPRSVVLSGPFPAGRAIRVEIPAEVTDLFGQRLAEPVVQQVTIPHAPPRLNVFPAGGVLMPDPNPQVQIHARNVSLCRARATWILSREIPSYLSLGELPRRTSKARAGDIAARPWEQRWFALPSWDAPARFDDSTCIARYEIDRLGPPPAGAHALLVDLTAVRRFPPPAGEEEGESEWEEASEEDAAAYGLAGSRQDTLRVTSLVRVSALGISSFLGEESGLLWVTDLVRGEPLVGATVSLWPGPDSNGTPRAAVWRGRTDEDGLATTPGRRLLSARGLPRFACAETSRGTTWLELTTPWSPPPLGFDAPNAGFLFSDRPIYRPGETVHWKAFIRDGDATGLHPVRALPVRARLNLADRQLASEHRLREPGNADGQFVIPPDCPTGYHNLDLIQVLPDGRTRPLAFASIQVEEFRAPRFEARIETVTPRVLSGGSAVIDGRFAYFAGGPLAGAPVRWHLARQPLFFRPKGWEEFSFFDQLSSGRRRGSDWMGSMVVRQGEAALDLNGRVRLEIPLVLPPEEGDSRYTLEVGARDLADQSATDRVLLEVLRGPLRPAVAGIWDEPAVRGRGAWRWAVVDTGGTIQPDVAVTLELWRRDWKTVRIRRVGGTFDYENTAVDTLLLTRDEVSGRAVERIDTAIPGAGYYILRARLHQPDGSEIAASESRWYGGEETASFPRETVQWLDLRPDRDTVSPRDTVRVVVPTPTGGAEGLLLLQSGGILRAERLRLRGTPTLPVPVGDVAPPDVTVSAVLVGPDRVPADDRGGPRRFLPYFATGSRTITIDDAPWRALVEVISDREVIEPGGEVTVEIRVRAPDGRPLAGEVALSAVDEAVLALVPEPDPDPLHTLFRSRGTGTEYDDTRYQLRVMPAEEKGEGTPGGGGEEASAMGRLRSRFDITAYWNPAIPIGPDGNARVTFRLPDALTRYRLRAVANTAGELFGVGEARVRVDRPLSVESAAPRFVRAGDQWTLGAVLQNRTRDPLTVRVTCSVRGGLVRGDTTWSGVVEPGRTRRVDFRVATPDPGRLDFTLRAAGAGGEPAFSDAVTRGLNVQFPVERVTEVAFGRATPRAEEEIDLSNPGFAGSGRLTAVLSPTLASDLDDAVGYLIAYPHACVEQIDSKLIGLLARRELQDRLPPDTLTTADIDRSIAAGLEELTRRLDPSTFRVWPDSRGGQPYLDAYTLLVLGKLKAAGIEIPEALWEGALAIARAHLRREEGPRGPAVHPDLRAFLLWARLEAGDPRLVDAEVERVVQLQDRMGTAGQLALLLALDRFADLRPAQPLLRQTADSRIRTTLEAMSGRIQRTAQSAFLREIAPSDLGRWASDREDRVRSNALAVTLLTRADPNHPLLPALVSGLIEGRTHGRWRNTHENALALEAVREYIAAVEMIRPPVQGRMVLGVNHTEGVRFEAGDLRPKRFTYSLAELQKIRRVAARVPHLPAIFEGDGRAALYYQLRLDRFVSGLDSEPTEDGLVLFREYLDAATGLPLQTLTRGKPILVHLALVVPRPTDDLVIEDPLPAGLEVVNLRLQTESRLAHLARPQRDGISAQPSDPDDETGAESPGRQSAEPGGERGVRLQVRHRDLRDDRARFYAEEVAAGVYHLYYPVTATTPGRFGTPAARAERLYAPEVSATSGPTQVEVK